MMRSSQQFRVSWNRATAQMESQGLRASQRCTALQGDMGQEKEVAGGNKGRYQARGRAQRGDRSQERLTESAGCSPGSRTRWAPTPPDSEQPEQEAPKAPTRSPLHRPKSGPSSPGPVRPSASSPIGPDLRKRGWGSGGARPPLPTLPTVPTARLMVRR